MEQSDYLEKQLDQLGKLLKYLLTKLHATAYNGQEELEVQDILETTVNLPNGHGITLTEAIAVEDGYFLKWLTEEKGFDRQHLSLLSEILWTLAERGSTALYPKCLQLYLFLEATDDVCSFDRLQKIEWIRAGLSKETMRK